MSETLIKVGNVSKKFCRSLKKSLWYGMQDLSNELIGRRHCADGELRPDEFWAVKDVGFELKRGECLGLIGRNGAGKTTLLRMLNGLIKPDQGQIEMRGRVGGLIALGAGFNPILTGRENVYAAGAVMGLTSREINKKYNDIVEFAELEEFMDSPVKTYSTGMQVRLGFAVAAQLEPDILLLDEVLAVGDIAFSMKSLNRVLDMMQSCAVIFVSHSMTHVSRVSTKILALNEGKTLCVTDDVPSGIERYATTVAPLRGSLLVSGEAAGSVIHQISLDSDGKRDITVLQYGKELVVNISATIPPSIPRPGFGISIFTKDMQIVNQTISIFSCHEQPLNTGEEMLVSVNLGTLHLNPGTYSLSLGVGEGESTKSGLGKTLIRYDHFKTITVSGPHSAYAPFLLPGKWDFLSRQKDGSFT